MIDSRKLIPIGCLLVTGALALAQTPAAAPVPTAPPAPPAMGPAPRPARAPMALPYGWDQEQMDRAREMAQDVRDQQQSWRDMEQAARDQAQAARDYLEPMKPLFQLTHPLAAPMPPDPPTPVYELTHPLYAYDSGVRGGIGAGVGVGIGGGVGYGLNAPMAFAQSYVMPGRRGTSDDNLYNAGLRSLDDHKWEIALEDFNQVAGRGGVRADGAWYWKAYTLNKLARRDEALAALAELRKSYASSRWLDEAKALEIEVKQRSGQPVSPESESDEELKLMALNGIMQSDPDRAIPLVENILKGPASPKLKGRALYVLAQSSQPKAQQVIEQIARGASNPDLQVKAIEYLGQRRKQGSSNSQNQLFQDIYGSTNDVNVKRAILNAYRSTNDRERLAQIAKGEKAADLRLDAFRSLASNNPGQPELWAAYQVETSPEMKIELLRCMHQDGSTDKIAEVVRNEKDVKVRRAAIEALADQRVANTGDLMVSLYGSEQDPQIKQIIVDQLSNQRNVKYLVQLARSEKDSRLKFRIVERLSNMHSKEAQDYLMELLQK